MKHIVAGIALTIVPATGLCAQAVEADYARGTLAVAAIDRGDWTRAEAQLTEHHAKADPAALINLGQVYMATGRADAAMTVWRQALASNRHHEVATLGGRYVSTAELAREALAYYGHGAR